MAAKRPLAPPTVVSRAGMAGNAARRKEGPGGPSFLPQLVGYPTVKTSETDSVVTTGKANVPGTISLRFGSE